jgi:hypothetical protein
VLRLSVLSGLPARTVVSILIDFWEWVDSVTDDGVILGVKLDQMSHICPDVVPTFWAHLRTVGWIAEAADSLVVPNFDHWMGNSAKKRLKDARRKRYNRKAARNVRNVSAAGADNSRTIRVTTGQDRTVENTTPPNPPSGGGGGAAAAGPAFDQDRWFAAFWDAYPPHKRRGRAGASYAWFALGADEALARRVLAALEADKRSHDWLKERGRYVPKPERWLAERPWEDGPPCGPGGVPGARQGPSRAVRERADAEERERAALRAQAPVRLTEILNEIAGPTDGAGPDGRAGNAGPDG